MTRSPLHDACPYGPDGSGYPPTPEPLFTLGADTGRDALFASLSAALEAVPGPVAAAVAGLNAADVRAVLESLPLQDRISVLRPLGMKLTPHKVGSAMAADVLNRLHRVTGHELRHAAAAFGWTVASDMMMVATGNQEFAEIAQTRVNGWPPAVARTGLWANGASSALGARIWVWAGAQPWFAPSAPGAQLDAVVAAARAVVDATPEFEFSPHDEETGNDEPDDDDLAAAELLLDGILGPDPYAGSHEAASADASIPADLDELRAAVLTLDTALHEAAAIASAVASNLGSGHPPVAADLMSLFATRADFDKLAATLRAAGVDFEHDSTQSMGDAVETAKEIAVQAAGDQPIRARLARVSVLRAPAGQDGLAADLAGAAERCAELAGEPTWSLAQRAEADALTALADLAAEDVSVADVFTLQRKLVAARPDLALLAISAATLSAPPAEATAPDSEPAGDDDVKGSAPVVADVAEEPAPPPAKPAAPAGTPVPVEPVAAPPEPVASPAAAAEPVRTPVRTNRPADVDVPDPASTATAPGAEVEVEADVAGAVADLIRAGRHALAGALTTASAAPDLADLDTDVLTVAALAAAVRGAAGPTATELRTQIANLNSTRIQTDTTSLLLATTALLRTALVTGEPTAGAILVELEPHLEPHLGKLASEVGHRALQGVLLDAPPLTTIADADAAEAAMTQARQDATRLLGPRKLRFKRASDIANGWFAPDGIIGAALSVVAEDNRRRADIVAEALKLLTDQAEMSDEIDARDRELRSGSSNPLQGPGRGDLLKAAAEAVGPLAAWTEAAASLSRTARSAPWSTTEVAQMRAAVLENAPQALAALNTAAASTDRLAAAAASAAAASLAQTVALLAGQAQLSALELSPADALGLVLRR